MSQGAGRPVYAGGVSADMVGAASMKTCRWPWSHQWSRWGEPEQWKKTALGAGLSWIVERQERRCEKCGKVQYREVG